MRNRKLALANSSQHWLQRGREITDGLTRTEYATHLFDQGKAPGTISIVVAAVKWLLKHRNGGKAGRNAYYRPRQWRVSAGMGVSGGVDNGTG